MENRRNSVHAIGEGVHFLCAQGETLIPGKHPRRESESVGCELHPVREEREPVLVLGRERGERTRPRARKKQTPLLCPKERYQHIFRDVLRML